MRLVWLAAAALMLSGAAVAAENGAEMFAEHCSTCHVESMSAAAADHADDLLAPPMNLLSTIVRLKTGDDRNAFVDHVVDFTREPAIEKVLAMPEATERFGLMPPVADIAPELGENDLRAVVDWLFDHYDYDVELQELREHQQLTP